MTDLEKSILATLAYYHVLGRPLTNWEIWRYLIKQSELKISPINFYQIIELLEKSENLKKRIDFKNGFYFFQGNKHLIKQRIERQKIADQKYKQARKIIKLIQILPYLRSIQISGSLAMNNPKKDSDIDLLIVAQSGRIWTARACLTLFAYLSKQYRHKNLTKDRLCLNHYLTEKSLHIPYHSLYNAQTYFNLVPLTGQQKLINKFNQENKWLKKYLLNYSFSQKKYSRKIKKNYLAYLAKLIELILNNKIGDILESKLKSFQTKRIKKDPLTYQAGGRIIFTNQQLEFHPNSPEKKILENFNWEIKKRKLDWPKAIDSGLT